MRITVIVTTYNKPDALRLVLNSLACQTLPAHEIVVADDGSTDETAECIASFKYQLPLHHAWQVDQGFRAGTARNLAVSRSSSEYLIFLDGDCIPPRQFIENHRRLAEPGWFVAGNRILLTERFSQSVLSECLDMTAWSPLEWLWQSMLGHCNRWLPSVYLPGDFWRKLRPKKWQQARTCNLALWRQDFERINGFNEAYNGWGHEDADLAVRLIRQGILHKEGRFASAVYHLWHAESDRTRTAENVRRLNAILTNDEIRAKLGLDQHQN